jgi:integrase/recombinase XerC
MVKNTAQNAQNGLASLSTLKSCWLQNFRSDVTRRGYAKDLEKFEAFLAGKHKIQTVPDDPVSAAAGLAAFLRLPSPEASRIVAEYLGGLHRRGLSTETANRALTAVRSFTRYAREAGATRVEVAVSYVKTQPRRDTQGCSVDDFQRLLAAARRYGNKVKAARDAALLLLLFVQGLRRSEIIALDIGDFNAKASALTIRGKGQVRTERIPLAQETVEALQSWMTHRGTADPQAPLFVGFRRSSVTGRLTGDGLYKIVRRDWGERTGIKTRPHGLRHAAITAALDTFDGDYRTVRVFSRHSSLKTIERYDDARRRQTGIVAKALAKLATGLAG